ncbi:DUF6349 family protein [Microbacterium esteraromaticum]|uniref:DUF6349 family protein n=1 Tax=Microbacterium esteraromaticum TaxID=57043 RepID=UPI00309FAA53
MSDALFDLKDFEPKPVYTGPAPLNFTRDYYHPDDLAAATRWLKVAEGRSLGSAVGRIHTWQFGITTGWVVPEGEAEHSMCILDCCLDCFGIDGHGIDYEHRRSYPLAPGEVMRTPMRCSCVGGRVFQSVCSVCEWHHNASHESEVVEAWHDHAFPGWRDLPVAPTGLDEKKVAAWAKSTYPPEWQVPAAPIRTWRSQYSTRHVPGRSPWGGFDLSAGTREEAA